MTGLMTAINASDAAETTQGLQVALSSATENIKALPYLECADQEEYQSLYKEWTAERPVGIVTGVESSTPGDPAGDLLGPGQVEFRREVLPGRRCPAVHGRGHRGRAHR